MLPIGNCSVHTCLPVPESCPKHVRGLEHQHERQGGQKRELGGGRGCARDADPAAAVALDQKLALVLARERAVGHGPEDAEGRVRGRVRECARGVGHHRAHVRDRLQALHLAVHVVRDLEPGRGHLWGAMVGHLLNVEHVVNLDAELVLGTGRDQLPASYPALVGDGDCDGARSDRAVARDQLHGLVQLEGVLVDLVRVHVDETARAPGHAPGRVEPVVPFGDRDAVHDRGVGHLQRLEDGPERGLGKANSREVVADPPLGPTVGHPRGLVQDVVGDPLEDHVLARPLAQDPAGALHHDVGVALGRARLLVRLDAPEPQHEVAPGYVREDGGSLGHDAAVVRDLEVLVPRIRDAPPGLAFSHEAEPQGAQVRDMLLLLDRPVGLGRARADVRALDRVSARVGRLAPLRVLGLLHDRKLVLVRGQVRLCARGHVRLEVVGHALARRLDLARNRARGLLHALACVNVPLRVQGLA